VELVPTVLPLRRLRPRPNLDNALREGVVGRKVKLAVDEAQLARPPAERGAQHAGGARQVEAAQVLEQRRLPAGAGVNGHREACGLV
jgi:hypothetical protein